MVKVVWYCPLTQSCLFYLFIKSPSKIKFSWFFNYYVQLFTHFWTQLVFYSYLIVVFLISNWPQTNKIMWKQLIFIRFIFIRLRQCYIETVRGKKNASGTASLMALLKKKNKTKEIFDPKLAAIISNPQISIFQILRS